MVSHVCMVSHGSVVSHASMVSQVCMVSRFFGVTRFSGATCFYGVIVCMVSHTYGDTILWCLASIAPHASMVSQHMRSPRYAIYASVVSRIVFVVPERYTIIPL